LHLQQARQSLNLGFVNWSYIRKGQHVQLVNFSDEHQPFRLPSTPRVSAVGFFYRGQFTAGADHDHAQFLKLGSATVTIFSL
jgi:hypothetical protein